MNTTTTVKKNATEEIFLLVKGAQEWLAAVPAFEPTPSEKIKAELTETIEELNADEEEARFFLGAAEVQIHIALEQKKAVNAALLDIDKRKAAEKQPGMLKALNAAFNRTEVTRKQLTREIDALFAEKRNWAAKLNTIRATKAGIKAIINSPYLLAAAAAEAENSPC